MESMQIVVAAPLEIAPDQRERLTKLGDVTFYEERAATPDEWLQRVQGATIICTGKFGLVEKWQELHDVYIPVPFVSVSWVDIDIAREKNITVSNAPGCNRHAVSEWIIGMLLHISRQLDRYINVEDLSDDFIRTPTLGLAYKRIVILGKGNIGSRVGEIAGALQMEVDYVTRGDALHQKVKNADVVVNCLGSNPTTRKILDERFFRSLQQNAIFISVTGDSIIDKSAMLSALDSGPLAAVADDAGGILTGDTADPSYRELLKHPNMYATPHIAYNTDVERRISNDMMIDCIEAWINGKPLYVVT